MSDDMPPEDMMAAEYALGLLEGEELLGARAESFGPWSARDLQPFGQLLRDRLRK